METKEQNVNRISDALFQKFVSEEIMTKSELGLQLDTVMQKYTKHIDNKFDILQKDIDNRFAQVDRRFGQVDKKIEHIDIRYNWIIGTILSVGVALAGLIFAGANFLSKLH